MKAWLFWFAIIFVISLILENNYRINIIEAHINKLAAVLLTDQKTIMVMADRLKELHERVIKLESDNEYVKDVVKEVKK